MVLATGPCPDHGTIGSSMPDRDYPRSTDDSTTTPPVDNRPIADGSGVTSFGALCQTELSPFQFLA
jgi:hypothetical protein